MADYSPFLGTWTGNDALGRSVFTVTWTAIGDTLQGQWIMDLSSIPPPSEPSALYSSRPERVEAVLGETTVEDGVLLFRQERVPFVSEFRLEEDGTAVMGVAVHKLAETFRTPQFLKSFEGHRVRFTRMTPTAEVSGRAS